MDSKMMNEHAMPAMDYTHTVALGNPVSFSFDLLTAGSIPAYALPWTASLLALLWIAQAIFLLEHGQTHRQTDRQSHRYH